MADSMGKRSRERRKAMKKREKAYKKQEQKEDESAPFGEALTPEEMFRQMTGEPLEEDQEDEDEDQEQGDGGRR